MAHYFELVMKKYRTASGFTLVEVILVIAVIAIMSALALPNFLSWLPNLHLRDASNNLYFDMQLARTTAMKRHKTVTVSFENSGNSYTISADTDSGGEDTIKAVSMPSYVILYSCADDLPEQIVFKSSGLRSSSSASEICLKNSASKEATLSVNLTGNITIE